MKLPTIQEKECDFFTSPTLTTIDTISLTAPIDFTYIKIDRDVIKKLSAYPKDLHHNPVLNRRFAESRLNFFPDSEAEPDIPLNLVRGYSHRVAAFEIFADELLKVFGWKLIDSSPKNGYLNGFNITTADDSPVGFLGFGGNINKDGLDTYQIYINGDGCQHLYSTEHIFRLYHFALVNGCKVKRVDIALDDMDGLFGFETVREMWHNEEFKVTRNPNMAVSGNPDVDDGKGRTIYIGSKKSTRYVRHYEKGKQLGFPDSPWVRHELELHNNGLDIPLEVLIQPDEYFAHNVGLQKIYDGVGDDYGMSPCPLSAIKRVVRGKGKIVIASMKDHVRSYYGKWLFALRGMYPNAEAMLDDLELKELPKRMKVIGVIPNQLSGFSV